METFILAFFLLLLIIGGMALGVIFQGKRIKGSWWGPERHCRCRSVPRV